MNDLPEHILCQIFSYLPVRDLCVCCCICRNWGEVLNYNDVWEQRLCTETPTKFQTSPLIRDLNSSKDKLIAYHSSWSEDEKDHSHNIYLEPNKLTIHRNPVAQSTDLARGRRGFSSGEHYWAVTWHGPKFGSSAVVGVCTEKAEVHCEGYHSLLGRSGESWGWDLSEGVLRHDGGKRGKYPDERLKVKVGLECVIGVVLDMSSRTLSFDIDGKYLGVAFRDLPRVKLYPAISAVYGNTEVSLVYRGAPIAG